MKGKYLVTGATGNIGRYVVEELIKLGNNVRAGVSNIERGKTFFDDKVEIVRFDFLDRKTFDKALENIDGVFLVRPPKLAKPKEDMLPFLKEVKLRNIKKIVFVSLLGVEKNPVVPHRKIENMIKELEIQYCFLRPSFFMQNLNTNHKEEIKERDELYIPVGKAKTSFIDTRDIGLAAAITLTEDKYTNKSFTLTGDTAIDYYEVADIMSNVLNRKIVYKNPSLFKFRRERIRRGTPKEFANVMMFLYLMTKFGTAKDITDDLEMIIGRKATSFKEYVIYHKEEWI